RPARRSTDQWLRARPRRTPRLEPRWGRTSTVRPHRRGRCRSIERRQRPGPHGSLRLHADAGVDADRLGVHVAVAQELGGEGGELAGLAEALGEEHARTEALLEL